MEDDGDDEGFYFQDSPAMYEHCDYPATYEHCNFGDSHNEFETSPAMWEENLGYRYCEFGDSSTTPSLVDSMDDQWAYYETPVVDEASMDKSSNWPEYGHNIRVEEHHQGYPARFEYQMRKEQYSLLNSGIQSAVEEKRSCYDVRILELIKQREDRERQNEYQELPICYEQKLSQFERDQQKLSGLFNLLSWRHTHV